MLQAIAFYFFSAILIAAAVMVIAARNPVHSVLFLILAFFNAAGLFVLLGAEFLAMILVVVYVGAVAVLFLFVVMMLDVDFAELKRGALQYLPLGPRRRRLVLAAGADLRRRRLRWKHRAAHRRRGQCHAGGSHQHRRARAHPLYRLCLLLPGRRPGAAGGDDRRHRADPAHAAGRAPPGRSAEQVARTPADGDEHGRHQTGAGGLE